MRRHRPRPSQVAPASKVAAVCRARPPRLQLASARALRVEPCACVTSAVACASLALHPPRGDACARARRLWLRAAAPCSAAAGAPHASRRSHARLKPVLARASPGCQERYRRRVRPLRRLTIVGFIHLKSTHGDSGPVGCLGRPSPSGKPSGLVRYHPPPNSFRRRSAAGLLEGGLEVSFLE